MDNLFTNVGAKLKAFAKTYFKITMWLLIVGGVISFFALVMEEYTAPYAFGILFGVPLVILGNLVACWILHAFGSIAEKHEGGNHIPDLEEAPAAQPQEVIVETEESEQAVPLSAEQTEDDKEKQKKKNTIVTIALGVIAVEIIVVVLLGVLS